MGRVLRASRGLLPALILLTVCLGARGNEISPKSVEAPRVLNEAEVKAAFLLNFTIFTRWPQGVFPSRHQPLVIAVTDDSAIANELQRRAKGFTVHGHPVAVVILRGPQDATPCHVLFIESPDQAVFNRFLAARAGRGVLVVGNHPESAKWGAQLAFQFAPTRLQFVVNRKAARDGRFEFSSHLLKLAAEIMD